METLAFANGQALEGHCLEAGGRLWLYLEHTTLADAFPILSIPENTETIRVTRSGSETVVSGYGHLCCLSEENGGAVSAGLKKAKQED